MAQTYKQIGVADQTYDKWPREHGGRKTDQAKKYRERERENARPKKLVTELSMDEAMLGEVARRTSEPASDA